MNHAAFRLAAGVAMVAVTVGACGGAGTNSAATKTASASATATRPATNGLEKMSATAVSHTAIGMFSLAHSVRIQGTTIGGVPAEKFDLRYEGTSISGSYVEKGSTYEYTAVGNRSYLKTSAVGTVRSSTSPTRARPTRFGSMPPATVAGGVISASTARNSTSPLPGTRNSD